MVERLLEAERVGVSKSPGGTSFSPPGIGLNMTEEEPFDCDSDLKSVLWLQEYFKGRLREDPEDKRAEEGLRHAEGLQHSAEFVGRIAKWAHSYDEEEEPEVTDAAYWGE